jgi:hypothetical protein
VLEVEVAQQMVERQEMVALVVEVLEENMQYQMALMEQQILDLVVEGDLIKEMVVTAVVE